MNVERMASLASKMMLTPVQAVALPAVVSRAAEIGKTTDADIVTRCFGDGALASYLADVCRTVVKFPYSPKGN